MIFAQKIRTSGRSCLIAATLFLSILFFVPQSSAVPTGRVEGFEDCTQFDVPPCLQETYDYASSGTGSATVSTQQAQTGTKSLKVVNSNELGWASRFNIFDGATTYFCGSNGVNPGIDFWVYLPTLPDVGDPYLFTIGDAIFSDRIGISIDSTGAVVGTLNGVGIATIPGLTVAINTWYNFEIACINTDSDTAWEQTQYSEFTTETTVIANTPYAADDYRIFEVFIDAQAPKTIYVDNINFLVAESVSGIRFCAGRLETNYGYDYVEDVSLEEDSSGNEYFEFQGTSGNSEYLGKGLGSVGSLALATKAGIQAAT